jgi:integrase
MWAKVIDGLENPIRRDLQFFVLFTGLRREDACTVRWEQVNLTDEPILLGKIEVPPGCIHRPKPKGGVDRAFTVPLSAFALGILRQRRAENSKLVPDDGGWVFPTRNMRGEVTCVQEMKEKPIEPFGKIPSPHRLRDTFATAASEAGLARQEIKLLMNHVLPQGDVTDGYIRNSPEHLLACVERVASFLSARLWPKETRLRAVPREKVG